VVRPRQDRADPPPQLGQERFRLRRGQDTEAPTADIGQIAERHPRGVEHMLGAGIGQQLEIERAPAQLPGRALRRHAIDELLHPRQITARQTQLAAGGAGERSGEGRITARDIVGRHSLQR
jgi:hypothetical protein